MMRKKFKFGNLKKKNVGWLLNAIINLLREKKVKSYHELKYLQSFLFQYLYRMFLFQGPPGTWAIDRVHNPRGLETL